jgi:hypothetical protein
LTIYYYAKNFYFRPTKGFQSTYYPPEPPPYSFALRHANMDWEVTISTPEKLGGWKSH